MASAGAAGPSFESFGLDKRLLKAILYKLCFKTPTSIQAKCIPLALEGKDVLARARTGSGKTAAYAVPIVHKILQKKQEDETSSGVSALVLVPTKELCEQVREVFVQLAHYCPKLLSVASLAADQSMGVQKMRLAEAPDVLIATPGRLIAHLEAKNLALRAGLEMVVFDEADLILSFGYEEDVRGIVRQLPNSVQCLLMSATLSAGVHSLKRLVLHRPVVLKLEEGGGEEGPADGGRLAQYSIRVPERDKYLLLYALVKLRLLPGKSIFFVNDVEKCYRLKIFFEQFGIKSGVLNGELPANSRYHVLQEFNRGIFDYLIATDEAAAAPLAPPPRRDDEDGGEAGGEEAGGEEAAGEEEEEAEGEGDAEEENEGEQEEEQQQQEEEEEKPRPKRRKKAADEEEEEQEAAADDEGGEGELGRKKGAAAGSGGKKGRRGDGEYGVSRGVDFRHVSTVVNVELPGSVEGYVHRVGRTARGGASGTALSLVGPAEEPLLRAIVARQEAEGRSGEALLQPFAFRMEAIEGFRYRVEDVLRGVTRAVVREARLKELRAEMLNSERLKAHFEEKPGDLAVLQHTKVLHPSRVQPHLKHVPAYLLPEALRPGALRRTNAAQVREAGAGRGRRRGPALSKQKRKKGEDPLSSFTYRAGGDEADGGEDGGRGSATHGKWLRGKIDKRQDRLHRRAKGKLRKKNKEPGQF